MSLREQAERHLRALVGDDRAGLRGQQAEVGQEVVLLGGFELLEAVVTACLLEDVDRSLRGLAHLPRV